MIYDSDINGGKYALLSRSQLVDGVEIWAQVGFTREVRQSDGIRTLHQPEAGAVYPVEGPLGPGRVI